MTQLAAWDSEKGVSRRCVQDAWAHNKRAQFIQLPALLSAQPPVVVYQICNSVRKSTRMSLGSHGLSLWDEFCGAATLLGSGARSVMFLNIEFAVREWSSGSGDGWASGYGAHRDQSVARACNKPIRKGLCGDGGCGRCECSHNDGVRLCVGSIGSIVFAGSRVRRQHRR